MIEEALTGLNPAFRAAVVLRDIEDLSYEEIAEVLQVSLGTVKSRILRGREALKKALASQLRPEPALQFTPEPATVRMMGQNNQFGPDDVRRMLRVLPQRRPSADLAMRLRVLASHESARRRSRVSLRQTLRTWISDFRLFADNLMRPLAIPTAGGFVSALLLFAVLAPGLTTRGATPGNDVPTVLYTEASVRSFIPLGFHNENITIEVTIDGDGRVIDYSLPNGPSKDPALASEHRELSACSPSSLPYETSVSP